MGGSPIPALRHIDSVEDALIASVNYDGDSDSTGSICGNIMGAIYGYDIFVIVISYAQVVARLRGSWSFPM